METHTAELEAGLAAVKVDVAIIRSNYATKADIGELRADMHKATVDVQRWMIATFIGLFVGFGGLFLAMSNALKPSSGHAAQPAPNIVTTPQALTPPTTPAPAPPK
ncbi:hypothetical protein [Massilia sp. CCM 8734]|uniref:hypothetical protein n=1 Tax=Massilia sp. CCM 8734 TaxID=2609283 RepID=UPI001423A079|nr:hypothetical protein [Massilia sp. CCM 8734]NHZ97486.1 hypothetical protein [Massilia sp. CCM 8734]